MARAAPQPPSAAFLLLSERTGWRHNTHWRLTSKTRQGVRVHAFEILKRSSGAYQS